MAKKFVELCRDGDLEGVQAALQSGVDVNSRDEDGQTGLMVSVLMGHTGVASLLLEQEGIDINICDDGDQTALHFAAMDDQNSECLAKMLLARTTSVNQRNSCRIEFYSVFEKRTMKSESFSKAVLRFDKCYLKYRKQKRFEQ